MEVEFFDMFCDVGWCSLEIPRCRHDASPSFHGELKKRLKFPFLIRPHAHFAHLHRAEWNAKEEPCQKKLPFDLWVIMKAEGSDPQEAAQQVLENCFKSQGIGLVELVTPKVCLGFAFHPVRICRRIHVVQHGLGAC